MKRSLIAIAVAAVATAALAAALPETAGEKGSDRSLPTYPEVGLLGAPMQLADAGKYRFNAGESTHELIVQDVGSV